MSLTIRTFVYCWLASVLLGCSLPATFTDGVQVHSRSGHQPPDAGDTATIVAEEAPLPSAAPHGEMDPSTSAAAFKKEPQSDRRRQENLRPDEEPAPLGKQAQATSPHRNGVLNGAGNMKREMQQPPEHAPLRISPAVETHYRVRYYLEGFCGRMRDFFERALARSGKYRALMNEILHGEGLPEKLVYLALIESGFSTHAYSRAHALGPWQFIRSTALHYGLTINAWVDERRDPVLSTRAAAAYLKDLHQRFGEWYLAAAAYNAGEGRVGTALQRSRTNDFWRLRQQRQHLKLETRDYVPKFVAAALIGREPEKYGFEQVTYDEPWQFDEVTIHQPLRLETVARLAKTTVAVIKELNPALLRNFTPPGDKAFALRLPPGSRGDFLAAYEDLPPSSRIKLTLHKVKKGEPLTRIAKQHGVTVSQLIKENGLKGSQLRPGQEIIVVAKDPRGTLHSDARSHFLHKAP